MSGQTADVKREKVVEDDYIPFGPEWEKQMMKCTKPELIAMLKKAWEKEPRGETLGNLHDKNVLILRTHVGDAKSEDGEDTYEISVSGNNYSPVIYNKKTKRFWSLIWREILTLAIESGINEEVTDDTV